MKPKLLKEKFPRKKKEGMIVIKKTVPVIDGPGIKKELNSARVSLNKRRLEETRKARAALDAEEKKKKLKQRETDLKRIEGMIKITEVNLPYSKALQAARDAKVTTEQHGLDTYVRPEDVERIYRFHGKAKSAIMKQRGENIKKKGGRTVKPRESKKLVEKAKPLQIPSKIKRLKGKVPFLNRMAEHLDNVPEEQHEELRALTLEGLLDRGVHEDTARFMVWRTMKR